MVMSNSVMTADCYVPVLKCKQGELGALAWVPPTERTRLAPLMEVRDGLKQAGPLAAAWPDPDNVLFVHPLNVDDHDDADWEVIVDDLLNALRQAGVPLVPVATTDDSTGVVAVLAAACLQDRRGAAIRLDGEATALAPPAALASEIGNLLAGLGISEAECDLVVDLGLVHDGLVARVTTAEAALRSAPNLGAWRNVILALSAFPESVGDVVPPSTVGQLPREDALAFTTVMQRGPVREPIYADYALGTPVYADIPWAPIPALRYASGEHWFIHRGATKANRSAQYVALAGELVASPHFAGAAASRGDQYFSDVAAGVDGPGNPTTYVRAGTSRHLACVLDRLATLGEP